MKTSLTLNCAFGAPASAVSCIDSEFALTVQNWNAINADASMKAFWDGGADNEGVSWSGAPGYGGDEQPDLFTTQLGIQLQNMNTWNCSGLPDATDCTPQNCNSIGKHDSHGNLISAPSRWGLLALHSVSNLHNWLSQLWTGIGNGQADATDHTSQIAIDFVKPSDKPKFSFQDVFNGAGFALGILGALPVASLAPLAIPGALAPWIGPASTIIALIGSELAIYKAPGSTDTSLQTAAAYSSAVANFGYQARLSLEKLNSQILNSADDTTLSYLTGGAWLQEPAQDATDIENFFNRTMIARGINGVWRQYNVFVYYVWLNDPEGVNSGLNDTNCANDKSGPQSTKFCAHGGVYYLYLWDGSDLQWPYGGWKFVPNYGINPIWAVESSIRSFKAQGIDYDPTQTNVTNFLGAADLPDFLDSPERLEGTFTLPVCDGSSLGQFNFDYEHKQTTVSQPPCMCGLNGQDTATWVAAAGLDAKKMARSCFNWWVVEGTANWPAADSITYGQNGANKITKSGVDKCRHDSGASDPGTCNVD